MSALCARSFSRPEGRDYFFFVLVDFPSREIGKIKRGFRALRSAAQGSALRTRKPFEKGLSESFIRGAVLIVFCAKKTAWFSMLRKTKQIKILFFSQNKKSEQNNSR